MTDKTVVGSSKDQLDLIDEALATGLNWIQAYDSDVSGLSSSTEEAIALARHSHHKAIDALAALRRSFETCEWQSMFGEWVKYQAGLPSKLWPNAEWPQDVAMIAHSLHTMATGLAAVREVERHSQKALAQPPGCGYPTCGCADITQCRALNGNPQA